MRINTNRSHASIDIELENKVSAVQKKCLDLLQKVNDN